MAVQTQKGIASKFSLSIARFWPSSVFLQQRSSFPVLEIHGFSRPLFPRGENECEWLRIESFSSQIPWSSLPFQRKPRARPLPLCWMIYMKTIYTADFKVQRGLSRRHFGKMAYLAMPGLLARSLNCNTTEVGLTIRGNLDWLSEQNPWGDCYSLPTSSNTWRQVRFLIDSRLNPDSRLNTVLKLPK